MRKLERGFTAVELLITLFVAAAFLVAGYQLYYVIIKDNGDTRAQASVANVAYNYLRQYSGAAANPCTPATPLTNSPVTINGVSNANVSITISCPFANSTGTNNATSISSIQVTITYNSPQQSVTYVTYVHDATAPGQQTLPTAPSNLTLTPNSTSQITASWTAPTNYTPDSYSLTYSTNSNFSGGTTINSITSTNKAITGLTPSTLYYIQVTAQSSQGVSSPISGSAATYTNWMAYSMITGVGDWNGDGKNDVVGYKPDGTIELHLGNGNATFGPAYPLGNIGTGIKSIVGPGKLPGGTAPILWWYNTSGSTFYLLSNGSTGVSGSTVATGSGYAGCDSVFALPGFIPGQTNMACKESALYIETLSSSGTTGAPTSFGSSWSSSYPGNTAFGAGDFVGNDGNGDIIGINTSGQCIVYAGNGTGTTGSGNNTCGSGWTGNYVTGGWDYNGDGKPDILRLYTAGSMLCFYGGDGNGGTASGGACSIPIN